MRSALTPCMVAALAAATTDAASAARGVLATETASPAALAAFVVAAAVVAGPLLLTAVAASVALSPLQGAAREASSAVRKLTGGHAPLAAILVATCLAVATTRAAQQGRALVERLSPHVAATALVVGTLAATSVALLAGALAARALGPHLVRLEARAPSLRIITRGIGARIVLGVVLVIWLDALLVHEYVAAPAAGILGWLVASDPAFRRAWVPVARRHRFDAAATVLVVVTLAAPHALAALPGHARAGVSQRPPYGSLILVAARRLVDRDHDGYSPILGGGDCDDSDPTVHPGARDVPGNGKDENCSGADATPFEPVVAPPTALPASLPPHPNIVFVLIDALRPDHLGFTGYARPTSPAIDRFRDSAAWFRRAYTPAPSTRYALASIFTGQEIESIPQRRSAGHDFELLATAETLAEELDHLGYDRVGLPIPYVVAHMPGMGQGFRVWASPVPAERELDLVGRDAPVTTDAALEYLSTAAEDGSRPFFLFAHYQCTHMPYVRHAEHDFGSGLSGAYDSALAYCDDHIGRLLDRLDARADKERTVVALLSDHGELLGERGLEAHGISLLEPAARALLLLRVPGSRVRTVDTPVLLTDLNATVRELAGAPPLDRGPAWSLGAFLFGGAPPSKRPLFLFADDWRSGFHYEARGIIDEGWKFLRDLSTGNEEVYDIEHDPSETHNVRRARPDVGERLSALLDGWDQGVEFR